MTNVNDEQSDSSQVTTSAHLASRGGSNQHNRGLFFAISSAAILVPIATACVWLGATAAAINSNLEAATHAAGKLKTEVLEQDAEAAAGTTSKILAHTSAAREAASDPLWTLARALPVVGQNFHAASEIAMSAHDVAHLGLAPLVQVYGSLKWDSLLPSSTGTDLAPLVAAAPNVSSAAHAVRLSTNRLNQIDESELLPQVAEPLIRARTQLHEVTGALDVAADASNIAPGMLGAQTPRNYLLIIQNNAETRASGGIPGALAVLTFDKGKLSLGAQSSAGAVGIMSPAVPLDPEQQQIYSGRMGKFMQDVNLTPDFPTAATTAQAMWERKTGQRVDGVISVDPVVLGYILSATGPVKVMQPELAALESLGLPTELTGKNVVQTLLSDVYAQIEQPSLQDAYFAGVAQEIFVALSDGTTNSEGLLQGLTRGTTERRVLVWSALPAEQSVIGKYILSGSIAGPSVAPAQFGVYYNDGTGAKMDYYVKRTVQLLKECPKDGYERTIVRVTSTNTAPQDAALSLPAYVTGNGVFGVPVGSVQTNIIAYGPVQANVESVEVNGQNTNFASYTHSNRPVGTMAIRLGPGESNTVDFKFTKIVQHDEPSVVVTPTVHDLADVLLATHSVSCG